MTQKQTIARLETNAIFIFGSALLISLLLFPALQRELHAAPVLSAGSLSATAGKLVDRLQIQASVSVRIDDRNDKIAAAIAHELGHVWIFTHHPYLQTEELANEVALRITDRETLKRVYQKMSAQTGIAMNMDEILPPDRKPSD
jgi:hypothetical protein